MDIALLEREESQSSPRSNDPRSVSPWTWGGIVALLLVEMVVLTTRFDTESLARQGSWWGSILVYARYLPQGLVAVGAAAAVFASPKWRDGLLRNRSATPFPSKPSYLQPLYLAAHLVAFATFLALTSAIWEGRLGQSRSAPVWLAAWFFNGLISSACLVAVGLPPETWLALFRKFSTKIPLILGFGAAVCVAGRLTGTLLIPLHSATFWMVETFLRFGFSDLIVDRAKGVIGTPEFLVEIAPECSGYEGIGLIWVFLAVYLWIFRRDLRFPGAFWLLPLGTVVIWFANALRIAILVVVGSKVSSKVALGGFHSQAGWLAFNAVALGLVILSRKAKLFALNRELEIENESKEPRTLNPTVAYLAPMLALVATMMLSTTFSSGVGFDFSYPLRVIAVAAALWACRGSYSELRPAFSWQGVALGGLVFAIWIALEPYHRQGSDTQTQSAATTEFASSLAILPRPLALLWLIARVFGSVVTVPIAEELAFRGYLSRRLVSGDFSSVAPGRFTALSFVISSLLFGAFHGRWLAGTLAGMVYALAYRRKGNLSEAVIAHATTNAMIAGQVLMTGAWSLWL